MGCCEHTSNNTIRATLYSKIIMREVLIFVVFAALVLLAFLYAASSPHPTPVQQQQHPPQQKKYDKLSKALKTSREARIFYSIGNAPYTMADVKWGECPAGSTMRRLGPVFEGGKTACLSNSTTKECLIYSWGSAGDFSFEEAIHAFQPACEIHTFDCTVDPPNKPAFVKYHKWCLGTDGTYWELIRRLNHSTRNPLLVKMDIEGWEWPFFGEYFSNARIPRLRQLIVEIHLRVSMALPERYRSLEGFAPEVVDDHGRRVVPLLHLFQDWATEFDIVSKEHNTDRSPPAPGGKVGCDTCAEFTLVAKE